MLVDLGLGLGLGSEIIVLFGIVGSFVVSGIVVSGVCCFIF